MDNSYEVTRSLIEERPDLKQELIKLLEYEKDAWTFDEVDIDSGAFGEIVSHGIIQKGVDEYSFVDSESVEKAISDFENNSGNTVQTDSKWLIESNQLEEYLPGTNTIILFAKERIVDDSGYRLDNIQIIFSLAILHIWGAGLILHQLGSNDFYHDELWQVAVIQSLRETGEFRLWSYITQTSGEPYTRGYLMNYAGYINSNVLGFNEFALRLFPAVIGILLIFTIFLFIYYFTDKYTAILTTVGFTFNILALVLARFLRPYVVFLFSLLLVLIAWDRVLVHISNNNIKRTTPWMAITIIFSLVSIQASQFGKIIFLLLPLSAGVYLWMNQQFRLMMKEYWWVLSGVLLLPIFGLLFDSALALSMIPEQLSTFLSINKIFNPTTAYYHYLFEKYIRFDLLFYTLFIIGLAGLSYEGIKDKNEKKIIFGIYTISLLFIMIHLFDRFEDPRYIYYLIPFVIGVGMFGLKSACRVIPSIKMPEKFRITALLLLCSTLIFYPVYPGGGTSSSGVGLESPSTWEGSDDRELLHRRFVSPDHSTAYSCVNDLAEAGDSVIVPRNAQRLPYITPQDDVSYYLLFWGSDQVVNPNTGNSESFETILNQSGDTYIIMTAAHLMDENVTSTVESETVSISEQIGVKKYNYNSFYSGRPFYWPSVNIHSSQDIDMSEIENKCSS